MIFRGLSLSELVVFGWILHLIADWFFQSEWMALNKMKRKGAAWYSRHPAAWVHGGIHFLIQLVVFPVWAALIIGFLHMVIDCKWFLAEWRYRMRQTETGPMAIHVAMWQDQVAHLVVLGTVALCVAA